MSVFRYLPKKFIRRLTRFNADLIKLSTIKGLKLTAKEIANAFSISYPTFLKLDVQPCEIEQAGSQKVHWYWVHEVHMALAKYTLESNDKAFKARLESKDDASLRKEQKLLEIEKLKAETAKIKADTEARLLKNEEFRKTLAPITLLEAAISKAVVAMGAVLDTIPMQVKKALPEEKAVVINIVAREVKKAQNAIAQIDLDLSVEAESDDESLND